MEEIWIASNGTDDFGEEEWILDKVYGGKLEFPEPLPIVAIDPTSSYFPT
jgi:hypothetical protein